MSSITISQLESALKSVGLGDRDRVIAALKSKGLLPAETVPVQAADKSLLTLRAAARDPEKEPLLRRIMATARRMGVDLNVDEQLSLLKIDQQLRANAEAGGEAKHTELRMRFKNDLFVAGCILA
jgi:hypothetical protein